MNSGRYPMRLIKGKAWVDLEPFVDVDVLEKDRHLFAKAIARNPQHIYTSIVGTQDNLFDQEQIELGDFAKDLSTKDGIDSEVFKELGSMVKFYTYCKYMYPVVGLNRAMYIRAVKGDRYGSKHLRDACFDTPVAQEFDFLFRWIESQDIFKEYGRVVLFVNEPGTSTTLHRDYPNPISHKNQFIWLTMGNEKSFFVMDDDGNKSIVSSRCVVFENANWHGSDPAKYASWSLRVDGIFAESFMHRSGLFEHFKGS